MRKFRSVTSFLVISSLVASACGGDAGVEVEDAWARESAMVQQAGAVYATLAGGSEDDSLLGVTVDPSVAAMAELHESSMSDDGMMSMSPVEAIAVPADTVVSLEPGGLHIMLMELAEPLEVGSSFSLTLTFENAGDVDVDVPVREG